MLSKQEVIELLRNPVYKVEVRLYVRPYTAYDNVYIRGGERINRKKHSLHYKFFDYIDKQSSIRREIFDTGRIVYNLQIKDDEIYEVSDEIIDELERTVNIGTTSIVLGLTRDGIYTISSDSVKKESDMWYSKIVTYIE